MGIKEEIAKIAVGQGYDEAKPKSIAQAVKALGTVMDGGSGGSGGGMVCTEVTDDLGSTITSHTAGEIFEAIMSGMTVWVHAHYDAFEDPDSGEQYPESDMLAQIGSVDAPGWDSSGNSCAYKFSLTREALPRVFYADAADEHPSATGII